METDKAPKQSTIKSHIVSLKADFCMFNPKLLSIKNSKISHKAPIDKEKENENIAMKIEL